MKQLLLGATVALASLGALAACSDADVASHNISRAAEQFEIERRIVFYNGITDEYMLMIEGRCSMEHLPLTSKVTCKKGPREYVRHDIRTGDNMGVISEQTGVADVSVYNYRFIIKPEVIIPNLDVETSVTDLNE